MPLTIGVPRESDSTERRVAMVPDAAGRLVKQGFELLVESDAGASAFCLDAAFLEKGCRIVDRAAAFGADIVTKVQPPDSEEIALMKKGAILVSFLRPLDEPKTAAALAAQGVTALSMELVPRTTRAQKMDALSAMSSVAGYQAALLGARTLPKFFPLLTTAAGTIRPAQVLVLGAGVAGLQAVATARRLGAMVSAYDVRPAAREEVESLGARFVELELETAEAADASGYAKELAEEKQRRQIELLAAHVAKADVVISTALIPGRSAPILISKEAVGRMAPGSVILDLAAPNGGNCTATKPGETVVVDGVTIIGPLNMAADLPLHASQMFARTVSAMITEFAKGDSFKIDFEDDIFKSVCVSHDGAVVNERVKALLEA